MTSGRDGEATVNHWAVTSKETSSLHCPVSTLPVELHSAILLIGQAFERSFVERSLERDELDEEEITELSSFELRVSHVSKHWRTVALGTGQLWSDIVIQPGYSSERAEAYFARSNRCLLNVQLRDCPDTASTKKILDLLFQDSVRWRTCIIEAGLDSLTMTEIVSLAVPNLEEIEINVQPPNRARRSDESWQGRPVLNGGSPRLKVANLHGFAVHFARPPLSNVTHLELDYRGRLPLDYGKFKEMLTNAPSLVDFSINGELIDALPHNSHSGSVVLPNLLRLCISSLYGQVYSRILLTVKAPQLQSLVLEGAQNSDLDPFLEAPYDLLHLRSFSLCGSTFSPSKLNKVYASFPSLEEMVMMDLIFNPSELLRIVSEAICDLGMEPVRSTLSTNQKPKTLALMLDPDQRSALEKLLRDKLIDEDIVDLENSGWSLPKFFDWLQNFVTAEILMLANSQQS
ncbi:hypothetical protein F5890DRAFT_1267871 [Lentinula detonsa]|uniref:F-box domain-containing protein n=1 Tax=Lentinula detonsa TaxID=2804962 RepID=A0AA38PZW4_9AGAR|nr:hypothetical protein F5890DRAFT_1267871 [Lentinula detonsa]